eukprot:scaffold49524_cov45-Phaeocystis_antarctica.AAC.3
MSKIIHSTVIDKADDFFAALKRRFYVTPKSFLELLSLYRLDPHPHPHPSPSPSPSPNPQP